MSKQLIQASLNLDLAKSYNPAQDAVEEIGKAVDSYTKYQKQQSEKAYQIAENLQEGMVGFDLMNDQAQGFYEDELNNVATELASARARKDAKEVRRLLAKGKSLVDDQNKIGQIIYAHSEDKLSDNYVAGANTHVLDLLLNKNYTVKENDQGQRVVVFDTTQQGEFNTSDGVLLSDLDKYAIPKDPNIASNYLKGLNAIAKQAQAGKSYENSPAQNLTNVAINNMLKDNDGLQNVLFTRDFQLKDGDRIADLYYKDVTEKENLDLTMDEFIKQYMMPGTDKYNAQKLTEFAKQKLKDGALNYNKFYFQENNSGGNYVVGKQSVPKETIDFTVNLLNGDKDFTPETAWNGVKHKRYLGQDFIFDSTMNDGKGGYKAIRRDALAARIGVMSSQYGYKYIGKQGGQNENNDFANSNDDNGNITLPLSLVTSEINDDLFNQFENIAPGFVFEKNTGQSEEFQKRYGKHDFYIVTAPNGKTMEIHLARRKYKEPTREKLEKFINDNRTK